MSLFDFAGSLVAAAAPILGAVAGGPVGAAIGTGVGALGSSLTNYQTTKSNNEAAFALAQYQNAYNTQMYERQKEDNLVFWNMQNEYNSPESTMQRLVSAGLNPKGTGLGQYANAGGISSPSAQPAAAVDYNSPLAAFAELGGTLGGLQQLRANIENTEAKTEAIREQSHMNFIRGLVETFKLTENQDKHALWRFINGVSVESGESYNFDDKTYRFNPAGQALLDKSIKGEILNEYRIKNAVMEENRALGIGTGDGDFWQSLFRMLLRHGSRLIE